MLKVKVPPAQRLVLVPVMVPGWAVLEATDNDLAAELPHAELEVTLTVPEVNVEGKDTETLVVPCPLLMMAPLGTSQV